MSVRAQLVGLDTQVPLIDGRVHRYVNFDYAASTPPLSEVANAVDAMTEWYSSVHRGLGWKSQVSTAAFEGARQEVAAFLGCRPDDTVIFTRNTTDGSNMLARSLPTGTRVISWPTEHHANMLPWRRTGVQYLPVPAGPTEQLRDLQCALEAMSGPALVAVGGASNVTGQIAPLDDLVSLAHAHGARVFVDAAQLAPHVPIDMAGLGIDYLAMSAHKLYAPYGAGVLAGRSDWLGEADPYLAGGGAVEFVGLEDVIWAGLPDRHEAGSPNVIGAVALGVACATLRVLGMERLAAEEADLRRYAQERMATVPRLQLYALWDPSHPHVGVIPFNLDGYHYNLLAAVLSAEWGIGVRGGCFCAHPLMMHLLQVAEGEVSKLREDLRHHDHRAVPGAVRASLGLGTSREDVDYLVEALTAISMDGPRWTYRLLLDGEYAPDPETRAWPDLPFALASTDSVRWGEGS